MSNILITILTNSHVREMSAVKKAAILDAAIAGPWLDRADATTKV